MDILIQFLTLFFFKIFKIKKPKIKKIIKPKKYILDVFAPFSAFFPKNFKK